MCFGHKGRKARALGLNVGVFKDHCSPFFLEIVSHSARKGKKKIKKKESPYHSYVTDSVLIDACVQHLIWQKFL